MSQWGLWRKWSVLAAAALVLLVLLGGCTEKEEEKRTGRYAENEIELPGRGYTNMYPFEDGSYALTGVEVPVLVGDEQGQMKEISGLWRKNVSMSKELGSAAAPDGSTILTYFPLMSDADYEAMEESGESRYRYLYVDKNGTRHSIEPSGEGFRAENGDSLELIRFSNAEDAYAVEEERNSVFHMNPQTGELKFLFAAGQKVTEFCFLKDRLIALDQEKAWIYDLEKGELLPENQTLNDFVKSHQVEGKSILLCADESGEDTILYLGCRTGLYRYVWDSTVIEQIADGQLLTFGNSYYEPQALQYLGDGKFRAFFSKDRLVELYYDETLPAQPEKELSVYSLQEDSRIRYAAQLFQKQNPQVLVKYETGMSGDNAMDTEDALKNLNTRLLAGEVPDVMVLDGMDVEQYAKKGVLKKLDEELNPYLEENKLFSNIVDGMRMTEEEKVYAIPLMVMLPGWLGDRECLEGEQNLEELVVSMEKMREKYPDQALLGVKDAKELLQILICTSLPAWTKEDGSLEEEKIEEFYEAAKRIWELNDQGMTQQDWEIFRESCQSRSQRALMALSWNYRNSSSDVCVWSQLGVIQCIGHDLCAVHLAILRDEQRAELLGTEPEGIWFGPYQGQAQNVFWTQTITGICEKAKEPELAGEFLNLLLSDEVMEKWWLNNDTGIPISRTAFERCLDIENNDWNAYMGFMNNSDAQWPNEEEQEVFRQMMEDAAVFYQPGSALEEIAMEVGNQVCSGALTPAQGASEVMKRMAIAMEE